MWYVSCIFQSMAMIPLQMVKAIEDFHDIILEDPLSIHKINFMDFAVMWRSGQVSTPEKIECMVKQDSTLLSHGTYPVQNVWLCETVVNPSEVATISVLKLNK